MATIDEILEELFEADEDCDDVIMDSLNQLSDEHSEKVTVKQFLEFVLIGIKDPDNTMDIEEYINSLV